MATTAYGDISPRTAAYAQKKLLSRAQPYLCIEKFGQASPIPERNSKVTKFRRYNALDATPKTLTEGVTPSATALTATDVTATLVQYGDRIEITDVIQDTHEDPVLDEAVTVLGEQSGQMIEKARYGVLIGGTNVFYANGGARNAVNTKLSLALQRKVVRQLKRQNANKITRVIRSTPDYGTENVNASFICLCHPDAEPDIRDLSGFVPVEKYGTLTPFEGEIGKVEDVRYIASTVFTAFADAGAAVSGTYSTTGTLSDVYPLLYIGRDSYGIVPLKGKAAITPMVVNPKPSDSDPLAQRGHAGWKCMQTCVILNDAWMVRAEVAVSA